MGDYSGYAWRELRGPDDVANEILYERNYPGNVSLSFLIVEGTTDKSLYQRYIKATACQIIIANGRDNAIQVLAILDDIDFRGALAIVDTDFDRLEGKASASPNLLFTDTHDLETMIVQSPAFEKVLAEFGSEKKIAKLVEKYGKNARSLLLDCAMPIGYLRWVSIRENLSLSFEELSFEKFIDKETLTINVLKLIRFVQSRSASGGKGQKQSLDDVIHSKTKQLSSDTHDPWHVCCGHDVVCALSLGLRKVIGSAKVIEPDMLEICLRLAYEHSHFRNTQLYISIQRWEVTNPPFVVLNQETSGDEELVDEVNPAE
jgi:hypothetical protein